MAGDFNAHSTMWNLHCMTPRNAAFLEDLIITYELQVLNDDHETRPTRPGGSLHSIIDLTLATPGAGPSCKEWSIVEDDEQATTSDHVIIEWKWAGETEAVDPAGLGPQKETRQGERGEKNGYQDKPYTGGGVGT